MSTRNHTTSITFDNGDSLSISIDPEQNLSARELWTQTVTTLIQEADLHGWEKEVSTRTDGLDAVDGFNKDILVALSRNYALEMDMMSGESRLRKMPVYEVLKEMISLLKGQGQLK